MAAYEIPEPVTSPLLSRGDDVYAKSLSPWTESPWITDQVLGEPVVGTDVWLLDAGVSGLDTIESYLVFANQAFRTFTVDFTTDMFEAIEHGMPAATRVYFRGDDLPAGLVVGQPYYVYNETTDSFQLKPNFDLSGSTIDVSDAGTGVMEFVATSYRSSADTQIGIVPARDVIEAAEGEVTALLEAIKAKTDLIATLGSKTDW